MKKRGQVSVFIIIGLIILLVVGTSVYLVTDIVDKDYGVPEEVVPIANYIDQCTQDIASDGIFLAGMQGGYIEIPTEIQTNPEAYLDRGFKIPHWFYNGKDRAPSIQEIEAELSIYVNTYLNDCLQNLDAFRNEWEIDEIENISTQVEIGEEKIIVNILIPVVVTSYEKDITITLPSIEVELDIDFGKMLELAYAIHYKESTEFFLEFYTDEIIASSDYLPYDGIEFTCEPRVWNIEEDIRPHLEGILMHNLHFLMFENTDYEETGYPYYDNIYKVDVGVGDMEDLKVTTLFDPSWGLDLQVLPSDSGKVKDIHLLDQFMILPCTKIYHHKYSTVYEIMFTITDDDHPEYPFHFVLPVNMRRNMPNKYGEVEPWELEIDIVRSREYCAEETLVTVYETDVDGNINTYEEMQQNPRYELNVYVEDSVYGKDAPLADVDIKYRCIDMECEIGTTSYPMTDTGMYTGLSPHLEELFPVCSNGVIIAEKEGYLSTKYFATVDEDTAGSTIQIPLVMLKPMDYKVLVMQDHRGVITERELLDEELAVITIENEELDYEQILVYPDTGEYSGVENLTLPVGDYTYELKIQLIEEENMFGGFEANWTVDLNDALVNDNVVFYALKKDPDFPTVTQEDYVELYDYAKNNSYKYPPVLS